MRLGTSTGGATPSPITLQVTDLSNNAVLLSLTTTDRAAWGFSPDDDRFVVNYLQDGIHYVTLYDLSASPAR